MDAHTRSELDALKEHTVKQDEKIAKMMELILQLKEEKEENNQTSPRQYGVKHSSYLSIPKSLEKEETDQITTVDQMLQMNDQGW